MKWAFIQLSNILDILQKGDSFESNTEMETVWSQWAPASDPWHALSRLCLCFSRSPVSIIVLMCSNILQFAKRWKYFNHYGVVLPFQFLDYFSYLSLSSGKVADIFENQLKGNWEYYLGVSYSCDLLWRHWTILGMFDTCNQLLPR